MTCSSPCRSGSVGGVVVIDRGRVGSVVFRWSPRNVLVVGLLLSWAMPGTEARFIARAVAKGANGAAQIGADVRRLEPGQPIERELAAGQSHSYQLALAANQYVLVIVEQRGIDVVVQLLGPDDQPIMEFDAETRNGGQEPVSQVAEVSGSYRLKLDAKQEAVQPGRYEIRVVELRAATERDRALQEGRQLHAEGVRLNRAGKYAEAISVIQRASSIREKTLGPEDPLVAEALHVLATIYRNTVDTAKAEPLFQRALSIREKVLGEEHPDAAASLNGLAGVYREKGDYDKAEPLFRRALAVREKVLGAGHPDVASSLDGLARLYREKGDYGRAEPLYQRALAIREKAQGPEHPDLATPLNNLALLYWNKGDYGKVEPLYKRALAIREKAQGPEHPDLATFLNNLALLYLNTGHYGKAELLYQRALAIREKAHGPEHPALAQFLNNLAMLYWTTGGYDKAELLYQRALALREKAQGPEHPDFATFLNNLGSLHHDKGDSAKAEPLYQRALAIRENVLGAAHPAVAATLNNLGTLYRQKGDHGKAEPLIQRALTISEKALGLEHPNVAASLSNLALLFSAKGAYGDADPLFQRALAIREKTLGPEHPTVGQSLTQRARLFEAKGDLSQAIAFQSRASDVSERNLVLNIAIGSERQKLAYLATVSAESDQTVSLHVRSGPHDAEARRLAVTTILRRKGRALDAMADSVGALRGRADPQDHALFDQLKELRGQVARLVLGGPQRTTLPQHQSEIKSLEARVERLEAEISRHSDEFRAQAQPITVSAIQSAIPANAALIEFYVYRPFNTRYTKADEQFGRPRYVAYILPSRGAIEWVDVGDADAIDRAVEAWRAALRDPNRPDAKRLARALDRRLMEPVRSRLRRTTHLLLSPDGALNLIPFGALVDEHNRYLIESYSFTYLTSGRDLLRLQTRAPSRQGPLLVANPLFDLSQIRNDGDPAAQEDEEARRSLDFTRQHFDPLPGTGIEARAVGAVLSGAHVLTGGDATEAAIKQVRGPSILHVATHGFFLQDHRRGAGAGLGDSPPAFSEDPLLRSGLILAGANQRRSGGAEDGILTASEMAALDLWGTKLVVLSACDTGLGEVKNGQGVYGLRRALVLAGAQSHVMSLWEVADRSTRELMVDYYKGLQQNQGRSEALRNVQLQMLRRRDRRHPYYWAAFIESGEWGNLDGQR
jgi:CHAT domain-containing protein/Tfp pilus assembly protein PilF